MPLATALFDYPLPEHLVAQTPAARRESAKTVCGFTDGKFAEVTLASTTAAPAKKAAAPAAKAKK